MYEMLLDEKLANVKSLKDKGTKCFTPKNWKRQH